MLAPMKTQYDKSGPTLVKAMKKRQFDARKLWKRCWS